MEIENTGKFIRIVNGVEIRPGRHSLNVSDSELVQTGIKGGLAGDDIKQVEVKANKDNQADTQEYSSLNAKDTINLIKKSKDGVLKKINDLETAKPKKEQRKSVFDAIEKRLADLHA